MIRRQTNDKTPNFHQRSSLWRECTTFRKLRQIHASMIINGFNTSRFNLRELIYVSSLVIPSGISYAHQVFDHITQPDLFMWNTMLRGSAQSHNPGKTVLLYTQMEKQGIRPDRYTFPFVLKACTKLSWSNVGCSVHGKIMKHGFELNTFVKNTLIYFHANVGDIDIASPLFDSSDKTQIVAWSALTAGYARRGDLSMARKVFDEMPKRDLISWNVMITGYAKRGDMKSARDLFDQMPKRDIVTWNAMIAGYVNHGLHRHTLKMFEEMKDLGEQPDEVTMLSLVTACTDSGDLDIGEKIHHSVLDLGRGELSILLGYVLIDMYAKCGSINIALNIFKSMKEKVVTTWNSIIGGLAFHGHSEEAINVFNELCRLKLKPNDISFVGVLVACSHAGRVEEGRGYFRLMREKYNIEPNISHYGCMVDLLGRAGLLQEAFEFVDKMEMKPNAIIWRTLLGSCTLHNNVELGRRANEELVKLRWGESGDYVLLSNIYASQGEWVGAQSVRKVMDDKGVRKEAASSLVDADEESLMHFFLKANKSQQEDCKKEKSLEIASSSDERVKEHSNERVKRMKYSSLGQRGEISEDKKNNVMESDQDRGSLRVDPQHEVGDDGIMVLTQQQIEWIMASIREVVSVGGVHYWIIHYPVSSRVIVDRITCLMCFVYNVHVLTFVCDFLLDPLT